MELDFQDKGLKVLCEKRYTAEKKLGMTCARKLRNRLSDLAAATRVTELVAGHPHPLKGDRAGQFALDLEGGRRLVFEPDHESCPRREDNAIDWSRVTRVRIVFIGDYHD